MRSKNPELIKNIHEFIDDYFFQHQKSPSCREIAEKLSIGKATAHRYLVAMNEKGLIEYESGDIKTAKIKKCKTKYFSAPVIGSLRGIGSNTEEEQVEEYVRLPESLFGKGEFYILRVEGDSMESADLKEGDFIVIQKNCQIDKGDIVVVLDDENHNNLKKYCGLDEKSQCYILKSENKEKYFGKTIQLNELNVQGVVRKIIKNI